ncbi:helix-turn-helix transcriptional regulator [Hydrogenophaga sp.]|uniref:helix-turn-helix transcriptional regulator n=1 Tax=Hydrogenophaga sp. TaxID=1904254 RepID=UPI0025C6A375|nr:helix-turn-helix transcriptional regulator [Hydrogenophaga sp.]
MPDKLARAQDKLARQSGVNRAVIAHIERQARNPPLLTLAKLAASLDLSLEALLTDCRS